MREELRALARRNLLAFTKLGHPDYKVGWVHREICARLMRFLLDVEARRSPRLILTMPPRHGKSELVSRRFPAWCLGLDPDLSFICASYASGLANSMNRDVRRIMQSPEYAEVFPRSALPPKGGGPNFVMRQDFFQVPGHTGGLFSAGVDGGITGRGADILSIDDPFKGRSEADSPTMRKRAWEWYASVAYTRLSPGGGVLVTATRWHEDDLVGRLLTAGEQDGRDQWAVVNFPAIAEEDEPHRRKGEALHPERYDLAKLESIRANVGEYEWNALYQQHPVPQGGGIFKAAWVRHWGTLPRVFDRVVQSWDFSFKDGAENDNVSGQVWGRVGANLYLLDCVTGKMDFVSQIRAMRSMTGRWPQALEKIVEDKANGSAIISALGSEIPGLVPYNPRGSKTARAYAVSPLFEAGNVLLPPVDAAHPWMRDYLDELLAFPGARHDDRVDATTQALDVLAVSPSSGVLDFL